MSNHEPGFAHPGSSEGRKARLHEKDHLKENA